MSCLGSWELTKILTVCLERKRFCIDIGELCILKSLARIFQVRRLQSARSIFSILNLPCSFIVYYYVSVVFYLSKLPFLDFLQFIGNLVHGQKSQTTVTVSYWAGSTMSQVWLFQTNGVESTPLQPEEHKVWMLNSDFGCTIFNWLLHAT